MADKKRIHVSFSPHIADPKQRKQTEEKFIARCIEGLIAYGHGETNR